MANTYIIGQITITNPAGYAAYQVKVAQTVADHGGHYLVRGGTASQLEGHPQGERHVVLSFASRSAAEAWYHSDAYQAIIGQRHANSTGHLAMVDGYEAA